MSRWVRFLSERFNLPKLAIYQLAFIALLIALSDPFKNYFDFPPSAFAYTPEPIVKEEEIVTEKTLSWPVAYPSVTQGFHLGHPGIDIQDKSNLEIHPIDRGWVSDIGISSWGYGTHIYVQHPNGRTSLYGHLSEIKVSKGQEVTRGTVIGIMGRTGWATGVHLHLEIYQDGIRLNPLSVLPSLPQ